MECGALNIAERALLSEISRIRGRSLDFLGNYTKRQALPDDLAEAVIDLLIGEIEDEDPDCSKLACFALSNCLFRDSKLSGHVISKINFPRALELLGSEDVKQVENIAAVFGNLVRKSEENMKLLIDNGVIDGIVGRMRFGGELGARLCLHLSIFCQWEEGRRHLKEMGGVNVISAFRECGDERVQRIAASMVNSILV
jgi:fused-like protein